MSAGARRIAGAFLAIPACAIPSVELSDAGRQGVGIALSALAVAIPLLIIIAARGAHRDLQRRLGNADRLHAIIYDLLSDATTAGSGVWISQLLESLARRVGANCAWLRLDDGSVTCHIWAADGTFSADDAETITARATLRFPWRRNRIILGAKQRMEVSFDGMMHGARPPRVQMILLRSAEREDVALLGLVAKRRLRMWPETANALAAALLAVLQTSRRRRLEGEQRELEQKLALGRRMETVGSMASGMAHNLNNIIGAIGGFTEVAALKVEPGSAIAENLEEIQLAVRRARAVVRDVLSFGRRLEGPASRVNMGKLLSETATLLRAALPAEVTFSLDDGCGSDWVKGEFGRLQQALLNLCNNAANAMPDGGTIACRCEHVDGAASLALSHSILRAGDYVKVVIRDEGAGIAPESLPRLFEPFFTTRAGGTGLGLSSAREIVEEHGGAIDVTSAPGEGSCFTLWLALDMAGGGGSPDSYDPGGGETILVVNPDASRLAMDEELVAALGYEPLGLTDILHIGEFEDIVDAVLVTGLDERATTATVRAIRLARWRVPVLLATACPASVVDHPALRYPLQPVDLAAALSRVFAVALG